MKPRSKPGGASKGKLHTGYFWPLYGDQDEVAFPFAASRAQAVVREALGKFCGVLLTDGYIVYERFAQKVQSLVHAQCWSHTRRQFVEAQRAEPRLVAEALDRIAGFYREEAYIREQGLAAEAKLAHRGEYTKPLVEAFFAWLKQTVISEVLLPSNPFGQAARYALEREAALKVFLADPDVPMAVSQNKMDNLDGSTIRLLSRRAGWRTETGEHSEAQVQRRYELLAPYLNEQLRRAWAAAEALTLGRGGNAIVADAIGISRTTLTKAKHEVLSPSGVPSRQRRSGGRTEILGGDR